VDGAKDNNLVGAHVSAKLAVQANGQKMLLKFNRFIYFPFNS
jgi:hypothetical protein